MKVSITPITLSPIKIASTIAGLSRVTDCTWFSEWKPKNELSYMSTPSRTGDATLRNTTQKAFYIPQIEVSYKALPPDEYSDLIQIVNTRGFAVEYYDPEIQMMVRRACYMTKSDLGTLLTVGGLYTRALEVKFTLISKLGYTSYSHLKELALNDDRFAGVGV